MYCRGTKIRPESLSHPFGFPTLRDRCAQTVNGSILHRSLLMNARPNWLRALPSILLALALLAPATLAQKKKKDQDRQTDNQDVMSRPRNKKDEVKRIYRDWVNQDVKYIITDKER